MRPLMLRLPDELHAELVLLAQAERRSLNGEIVYLLEESIAKRPRRRAGIPKKKDTR